MAPPPLGDFTGLEYEGLYSNVHGGVQSKRLAAVYASLADQYGTAFLDVGRLMSPSRKDAVHFEAEPQAALARAIAAEVRKLVEG